MNPKPTLDGIADAILDGTPIDWRSLDTEDLPDKAFVEPLGGGDARGRLGAGADVKSARAESGARVLVEDTRYRVGKLPIGRT